MMCDALCLANCFNFYSFDYFDLSIGKLQSSCIYVPLPFLLGMAGRSGVNARSPFLSFFPLPFSSLFPLLQSPRSFLHFTLACYYRSFTHPHTLSLFLEPFFVNNTLIQRLDSCTHSILFQYPSHTFTTNNDFILNSLFHSLHVAPPLNRPSSPDLNTHSCAAQ